MTSEIHAVTTAMFLRALTTVPTVTLKFRAEMRARRINYGFTIAEVADFSGYSRSAISFWEGAQQRRDGHLVMPPPVSVRDWIIAVGVLMYEARTEHRRKGSARRRRRRIDQQDVVHLRPIA